MTSPAILGAMGAVMIDPPAGMLEERSRLGHDVRDEVWDGVLHMVPQPTFWHQQFASSLEYVLHTIADRRGYVVVHETSTFEPNRADNKNYRVPDVLVVDPKFASKRGVEGRAELVVEILSPNDESRDKLDFYALCEVQELWIVDPDTRAIEIYVLRGARYFAVTPDRGGILHAPRFAIDITVVDGPKLRLVWDGGTEEI